MFAFTKLMQAMVASGSVSDPQFYLTTLLLNTSSTNGAQNNTFLDSSTNNFTITRNGNTTQGTFSPFSQTGWGNYFDGSSELVLPSNAALAPGTGDFCVEFWIYPVSAWAGADRPVYVAAGTGGLWVGWQNAASAFVLRAYGVGNLLTYSTAPSLNQWSHIAICRSGTNASMFINGSRVANGTVSQNFAQFASYIGADAVAGTGGMSYLMSSYVSNFRLVKGSSVYDPSQTTLTVPTSALTAITNTSLLTCQSNRFIDNSSNAFAITVNGTPSVQAFSPFAPTTAYDTAVVGGSGYFDGSGDSLSCGTSTNLALGSGDWAVEFWIYQTATGSARLVFDWRTSGGTPANVPVIGISASQFPYMEVPAGTGILTSSIAIQPNAWTHVEFSRLSGTLRVFVNGASGGSVANSTNFAIETLNMSYSSAQLIGYVSGVRIIKGTGYSSVTVPTAPPTAITNTQLLLNFTNAGIYDSASKNVLETVGNAQVSTTQAKWGTTSMYFDGAGDYLFLPASQNTVFGTGDFTIEFWIYYASASGSYIIFDSRGTNVAQAGVAINTASGSIYVNNGTSNIITATAPTANAWHHIALSRSGSSNKLFIDGTQAGSTATSSTNYSTAYVTGIGTTLDPAYTASYYLNGYIDDLRITKYARYTANFTAPTAAFPTQ